jgi:hypothetical protein
MSRKLIYVFLLPLICIVWGCKKDFLNALPEDRITSDNFWKSESDVKFALNSIYAGLRARYVFGYGPQLDACSPDGYQWAHWEGQHQMVGDGSITTSNWFVEGRWTDCYTMIYRANYFLDNVDKADISEDKKKVYVGEAHFLRGVAYSLLAHTYGGVPIFTKVPTVDESRDVSRASLEDTWSQVIADYQVAIDNLPEVAAEVGAATKGAALGMMMRAYQYQGNWEKVNEYADKVIALNQYELYPSYPGIFKLENENNKEVIFDVQFMDGPFEQQGLYETMYANNELGAIVAPVQQLVDAYETLDGSPVDPAHPWDNRDPRLNYTVILPGTSIAGEMYPNEVHNSAGQRVGYCRRKYMVDDNSSVTTYSCVINYIVLRYADVLLSKAEAMIELGDDIDGGIGLINRIRTERSDVHLTPVATGLSQDQARQKLRHERRIELACEGLFWDDVRRWNNGSEFYPREIKAADGSTIEVKFPAGYADKYNLLPIPESERSLNPKLEQNPGY